MANMYIGNPLELMKEYINRKEYRSLATMTEKECHIILGIALDNGEWSGDAINNLKISSAHSNFVEGDISFGHGDTYGFYIRYDGTVQVYRMDFVEKELRFVPTKERLKTYRFCDVTFYMMKMGFDLISHLK